MNLFDGALFGATTTDAQRRGFPASHTRPIEASIDPLAARRLGRPAVRGSISLLELSHRFEPLPAVFFAWMVAFLLVYSVLTHTVKMWFIRKFGTD